MSHLQFQSFIFYPFWKVCFLKKGFNFVKITLIFNYASRFNMEQIILEVPVYVAQKYKIPSSSDKSVLLSLVINFLKSSNPAEKKRLKAEVKLLKTMAEIGQKATERRLTDEISEKLLNEE